MPSLRIHIYQSYDYPNLLRQSPSGQGQWDGASFHINPEKSSCDVAVVLNNVAEEFELECRALWRIVQEPPVVNFPWAAKGQKIYDENFLPVPVSKRYCTSSHGALPWHIEKNFDELMQLQPADKPHSLSWTTTNKEVFPGHRQRMLFLEKLKQGGIDFDLFGRGFNAIDDKYESLGAYRYALAIENHRGPYYWTEKIADCFLSWTVPIYYGCTNLADYFPEESFVAIDIEDPDVLKQIAETIRTPPTQKQMEAIGEARQRVLKKHQIFPFITQKAAALNVGSRPMKTRKVQPYKASRLWPW